MLYRWWSVLSSSWLQVLVTHSNSTLVHTHKAHTHTLRSITHPYASLLHHISGSLTSLIYPDSCRGQKYNCEPLYFTHIGSSTTQTHSPTDRGKMAAFIRGCFSFLFKPQSQPIHLVHATDMKPFEYDCISVLIPQIKPQETLLLFLCSVNVYTASDTKHHGCRWTMPTGNHISNSVTSIIFEFSVWLEFLYICPTMTLWHKYN